MAGLDRETSQDDKSDRVGEDRIHKPQLASAEFFRNAVLSAYNERCCITGLSLPTLLVASHIVPWRHDSVNRVNPRNGLLLSVLHDKAFDSGFITLRDDMTVQVSRKHSVSNDKFFSESIECYDGKPISLPRNSPPKVISSRIIESTSLRTKWMPNRIASLLELRDNPQSYAGPSKDYAGNHHSNTELISAGRRKYSR